MSPGDRTGPPAKKKARKPPPRWRRYLVQAELELPPPGGLEQLASETDQENVPPRLAWWQEKSAVLALAAVCALLLAVAATALITGYRDRAAARAADERVKVLTLRAVNSERALRIAPNRRSWSAAPDAVIAWPEPPQLLEFYLPVGYANYPSFALVVEKVDHGRVLVAERLTPDSNRELRLAVNSSAFGPGEYRIRLQGYTWRGQRVDAGWIRLRVEPPRTDEG